MPLFPEIQAQFTSQQFSESSSLAQLELLWQHVEHLQVRGARGLALHWVRLTPPHAQARVLLVPGRIEAVHKYAEVLLDLTQAGYEVWAPDHRGQGQSGRECDNSHVGYVADFSDYAHDLQQLIERMESHTALPTFALAHSMGGAILYRTLQLFGTSHLQAAVFCAPMFGIPTAPLPAWLAQPLAQLAKQCVPKCYVPGQQNYVNKPFADNDLTTCEPRYQWFRQLYQRHPDYQLGGVSWGWLACALAACQQIQQNTPPTLPMLLLQAELDTVVCNDAQQRWQRRSGAECVRIAGAKHELLNGEDSQRTAVYHIISQWLQRLESTQSG